jgi:hypothetical protein
MLHNQDDSAKTFLLNKHRLPIAVYFPLGTNQPKGVIEPFL